MVCEDERPQLTFRSGISASGFSFCPGGLLLGLELSNTTASIENSGTVTYGFTGISIELTDLRIRGTVEATIPGP